MPAPNNPNLKVGGNQEIDIKAMSFYSKLKKLFSTDTIVRNIGGKKLKQIDTDQVMYATDRNSFRDSFNRVRSTGYNAYTRDFTLSYQAARLDLFRDFDIMDHDPILTSALDIYADECLVENEMGQILNIRSDDDNIKKILNNLFYDILNIEFNLWSWTRNVCKYGDFYLKHYISPEYGIYMVEPISAYNVERIENSDPLNKNVVRFQIRSTDTSKTETLEKYEVSHFRLLSDSNFLPYGKSMIEGARRIWKQLCMVEDAMLIHRIMRAPDKRLYKIDVGSLNPNEIEPFIKRYVANTKKVPYIDERTGDYNLRYNMENMIEDIYIPVRGSDTGTSIENLSGMEWTGTDDVEYLRNKLMAALKIPKAFLGYDESMGGKSVLAAEDVRFARTIGRIQKMIVSELNKIAVIHLYAQGYRDKDLVNFKLSLNNPSTLFEKEKLDIWSDKADLSAAILDAKLQSKEWVQKNIWKMSDDEILDANKKVVEDTKDQWRLAEIEENGNDPASPYKKISTDTGGESGGEGGDLPGDDFEEPSTGGPNFGDELGDVPEPGASTELAKAPEPVKEEYERPSQEGEKDARDYPRGEDPLGRLERSRRPRKVIDTDEVITLSETAFVTDLKSFFADKNTPKLKRPVAILTEAETPKSILDPSIIIPDGSETTIN